MAGDHSLWPPNSHNVNPGLIFVQGVQHDLQEIKEQGVRVRPTLKQPNKYCNCSRRKLDPGSKQSSAGVRGEGSASGLLCQALGFSTFSTSSRSWSGGGM